MAARLGMRAMPLPARTIGDHQAEYVLLLGMLAATCSKIGREVYTLMKQEFGELEEPVPPGTVGSSTMPQKRNPKLSQDIIAAAAQIRALVPLALEAMQTEHEADRTTSIMMSRAIVQSCELTGDMLQRMIALLDGLQVFPDRMRENLDLSGGLIMAEALMLELGKQIGRQRAHDAVYEAAQSSVTRSRPFREMLAEDPHVSAGLTPAQIESLLDPARYTGLCRQFAERGAASARELAATLKSRPPSSRLGESRPLSPPGRGQGEGGHGGCLSSAPPSSRPSPWKGEGGARRRASIGGAGCRRGSPVPLPPRTRGGASAAPRWRRCGRTRGRPSAPAASGSRCRAR